ncbi:glycoside hydrolase family 140 protein [Microbacter margulisiae]|uniref:DUF4038 domain-containing protein n=1 Tax=Microbacter margulisiae TaxID=1350067 RepID=A0A7W5DQ50_9PORP|nr:glycoside hydrolase family 140 protein [Microbacter margulisiae]MBB3187002.1 hypothetical protein [Microbacter margulisiae]
MNSKNLALLLSLILLMNGFSILNAQNKKEKAASPWNNGRLRVSDNHRFLQYADGKPFFWLGETAWLLPSRSKREEVSYFMDETAKSGFNVVLVSVLHTIPAINSYGQLALPDGFNFKHIDKRGEYSYWQHVDFIVQQAKQYGIYVGIVCVWGTPVKEGQVTIEDARKYGRFLAERYKKYPNIIWIIGGDTYGNEKKEIWETLANTIKQYDPNHLMTFHPRGRTISSIWFDKDSWLDFNMFQSGHRRYGQQPEDSLIPPNTEEDNWRYVERSLQTQPLKPVLDGEPSYEDIPQGLHDTTQPRWKARDVRRYAYWSVFAGSCGHTYGNNSTMQMYHPGYMPAFGADRPWYETIHDPGCLEMQYVKDLIYSFPYFDRIPDQSVIAGKNGTQYYRDIATRGNDYILVYNYTNTPMDIDMTKISGDKKNAWWFNPHNGALEYIGEFNNGKHVFVHDGGSYPGNDHVLIITDARTSYIQQDQKYINK